MERYKSGWLATAEAAQEIQAEVKMDAREHTRLIRSLEQARNRHVDVDGRRIPESISILISMLSREFERNARYDLYYHITMECRLTNSVELQLQFSEKQYREFQDINSLICYSEALVNAGYTNDGLERSRDSLEMAIRDRRLINHAAVSYIRNSIEAKSAEAVNVAIKSLILSIDMPRGEDSVLEIDWITKARMLGADPKLLSAVEGLGGN